MAKPSQLKILVAIPAYSEERYLGSIILKAQQYATADMARLAGASVIQHQQNKGYGASIQTLLAEARKKNPDVLVLLDADFQHNPDEIPHFIKPILEGSDLVIGSRKAQASKTPRYRRIGQKILLHSTHLLTKEKLTDSECGFRAFSRKAISKLHLTENGFAIATEMIAKAADEGLKNNRSSNFSYLHQRRLNPESSGTRIGSSGSDNSHDFKEETPLPLRTGWRHPGNSRHHCWRSFYQWCDVGWYCPSISSPAHYRSIQHIHRNNTKGIIKTKLGLK